MRTSYGSERVLLRVVVVVTMEQWRQLAVRLTGILIVYRDNTRGGGLQGQIIPASMGGRFGRTKEKQVVRQAHPVGSDPRCDDDGGNLSDPPHSLLPGTASG
jgi:hypothetical protein